MLNYKQIWHGIKPTEWLIKFNLMKTKFKLKPNQILTMEIIYIYIYNHNLHTQ